MWWGKSVGGHSHMLQVGCFLPSSLGSRCIDMKGFRVEGQQLGAAQTETVAHPGECRHCGHATKLHSFQVRGAPPCDCWHF